MAAQSSRLAFRIITSAIINRAIMISNIVTTNISIFFKVICYIAGSREDLDLLRILN